MTIARKSVPLLLIWLKKKKIRVLHNFVCKDITEGNSFKHTSHQTDDDLDPHGELLQDKRVAAPGLLCSQHRQLKK